MIEQFITYLRAVRGYSENTITAYRKDLVYFVNWVKSTIPDGRWSTITRQDIDRYVTMMVEEGLKPATTNRRIASLSHLYKYFQREGMTTENPCRYESRRKNAKTLPNTIPAEDLRTAYEHSNGVVKEMLGLLISTGIRIQEMLDIRWEDIDFRAHSIRINGKGSKQRIVYSDKLQTLETVARMGKHGLIFTQDQRTARHMIYEALRPYSNAKQLSPHAIRHSLATNMASHGANVATIARALGHNDIKTTQKYIDMTQMCSQPVFRQYSILA